MFPSSPPPHGTRPRKRTRLDFADNNDGSDFVFSSDPVDPALDVDRRTKRVYKGTWWAAGRVEYERNFDSGIFMASDSSEESLPLFLPNESLQSVSAVTTTALSPAHIIVNQAIEAGEEVVDLSYVFSCLISADFAKRTELTHHRNLAISKLSPEIPCLLKSLVTPPRFSNGSLAPHEQQFQSLVSKTQLYLANNLLTDLPATLWSVQNLTVLSLRNNGLVEIPGAIGQLRQLKELNLGNNKLRWLPWELLGLMGEERLTKVHVRPNPFFVGFDVAAFPKYIDLPRTSAIYDSILADLRDSAGLGAEGGDMDMPSRWLLRLLEGLWQTMKDLDGKSLSERGPKCLFDNEGIDFVLRSFPVASSEIAYLEADGTCVRQRNAPRPSRTPQHKNHVPADPYATMEMSIGTSRVPSLLELAMTRCADSLQAGNSGLKQLMPTDMPVPVMNAIDEVYDAINEGGRICTSCSRRYVIPRTEWVEYWHCIPKSASIINLDEMFWPFLRRGCSWACTS